MVLQQGKLAIVGGDCEEYFRWFVQAMIVAPDIVSSKVWDCGHWAEAVGFAGLVIFGLSVFPGFFGIIHLTPILIFVYIKDEDDVDYFQASTFAQMGLSV